MTQPILKLSDVSVAYGRVEAARNISLELSSGSIVTVIGANGAGKSTLLNAIMGILPISGEIRFAGEVLGKRLIEDRVRAGLSLVPEKRELFTSLSVLDNLVLGAYRLGAKAIRAGLEEVFVRFPRLEERKDQMAGTLSGGERQMLAMGRALMGSPSLLMLDEPSLGLAPLIVKEIFHIITDLRKAGVSILLVEQNARAALQVADYAYVMELGEITMQGKAQDLANNPRVIESYLGIGPRTQNERKDECPR